MSKDYKYKMYKEKDSMDKDKLSKPHRRELEASYRMSSKKMIQEELETLDYEEDNCFDNEMLMSSLCYRAEVLSDKSGKKFECTCPNPENDEIVQDHVDYLRSYIGKIEIELLGE